MQITVFDEQKRANVFDLRTPNAFSVMFRSEHYAFRCKPGSFAEQLVQNFDPEKTIGGQVKYRYAD